MIGLVDGNNFYVSCERVFDLSLEGRPVAVLSNNDGCVISRSQEFKALDIPMGTPYFKLKPIMAKSGIVLKSSNYELYGDMSRRLVQILHEFAPVVEPYSIDEAFIELSIPSLDYYAYSKEIRSAILKWIGIPCGVGFAPTKTLAKIANHIGKKRPEGVFIMPADASNVLRDLTVEEVWGIGSRLGVKLRSRGIRTALQLAQADIKKLQDAFSVNVARTALELRGTPAVVDEDPEDLSQSVSCSRSFGYPVEDLRELEEAVSFYTASSAEKLRKEKQIAAGANVYFQYYPEYGTSPSDGGFTSTTVAFEPLTDDTSSMLHAIRPALRGIYREGRRYKKAGVVFFGLEPKEKPQPDLFTVAKAKPKRDGLYQVVDEINSHHGRGAVFTLSSGIERKWAMKLGILSPSYTTRWNSLPSAK